MEHSLQKIFKKNCSVLVAVYIIFCRHIARLSKKFTQSSPPRNKFHLKLNYPHHTSEGNFYKNLRCHDAPQIMKTKILITVSYILEAEKYDFWDKATGRLTRASEEFLRNAWPEKTELPCSSCGANGVEAVRYSLKYQPLEMAKMNFLTCAICKRALTDPTKPNPIRELDCCTDVHGVKLCAGCAYQLELDIRLYGVDAVMRRFSCK